jgi:hypothetical protein
LQENIVKAIAGQSRGKGGARTEKRETAKRSERRGG